ncbi:uncharacterized protein LOC131598517 [Vicia villosa]|uniref:uncharacterized protein LOC131598517 n=1 Tax=Vicia villosa TaxID=3911 RepID=UPI00273C5284|nr:uncharacterized protein LOC131598517 [Vicia villosa]
MQTPLEHSGHTPSTCISSSRRHRDDGEADTGSLVPPPDGAGSPVVPPDGVDLLHEDADAHEGYLGVPSDLSLLAGYIDHIARHVWNREDRVSLKFNNHGRNILSLQQPVEPWFQDVLTVSRLKDLCQIGYPTIHNGISRLKDLCQIGYLTIYNVMLMEFAER